MRPFLCRAYRVIKGWVCRYSNTVAVRAYFKHRTGGKTVMNRRVAAGVLPARYLKEEEVP